MANWIVDFKSISGNLYRVQIAGAPGQSDISLIPSDHPFYIEEEGKDDLFLPVKTQSGYVEVITDDFSLLKQILPTKGGTRSMWFGIYNQYDDEYIVLFKGWVQPKILTFNMWHGKQKLRIPIECELSALKYRTSNIFERNIEQIYKIIGGILTTGHPIPFEYIGLEGNAVLFNNSNNNAWLFKKAYTSVFFDENNSYLDILESICTFFGWTARTSGTDVALVPMRNINSLSGPVYYSFGFDAFKDGIFELPRALRYEGLTLVDSDIYNDNITAKYAEGIGKATVECSIQTFDTSLSFPDSAIKTVINDGDIASEEIYSCTSIPNIQTPIITYKNCWKSMLFYDTTPTPSGLPMPLGDSDWDLIMLDNTDVILDKGDPVSIDENDWVYKLRIWDSGTTIRGEFQGLNMTRIIYIRDGRYDTYRHIGDVALKTKNGVEKSFDAKGILKITIKGDSYIQKDLRVAPSNLQKIEGMKIYVIKIAIGGKWYNGETNMWDENTPENKKWVGSNVDGIVNLLIPSEGISGSVEIHVKPIIEEPNHTPAPSCIELSGLTMEYSATEEGDVNSNITELEHVAFNDAFVKKSTHSTNLCVKENPYMRQSKNVILNSDGTTCVGLAPFLQSEEIFNPLQRLADDIIEETSLQNTYVEIPIKTLNNRERIGFTFTLFNIFELGGYFYPVAYNFDARTEEMKLKLIKR